MIRHIGIGALSGLVLFASFVTVVAIVAGQKCSCRAELLEQLCST